MLERLTNKSWIPVFEKIVKLQLIYALLVGWVLAQLDEQ